jgi:hypothetical protein
LEPLDGDVGQHSDRVAAGAFPQLWIDRPKEILGLGMPAPTKVTGQIAEWLEGLWQHGANNETADSAHRINLPANFR